MQEVRPFLIFTRALNKLGLTYMVTGSVASMLYGEIRLTNDVDLVVVLDRSRIPNLLEAFPEEEFYVPPAYVIGTEASRAQRGLFNLLHHATGFKADIYLSGQDPLNAWALPRSRRVEIDGEPMMVAPPEYVIVRKLEFYREGGSEKHLRDIRSMLDVTPELPCRAELEQFIAERGLQALWRKAQEFKG
jgi:hypothetical protein